MIKYVFWDSDNTLINTAEHHWRKHFETLKSLGITLDETYRNRVYTHNGIQNWEWMAADLGLDIDQDEYLNKIDQWYFDHIDEIQIRAGVEEAIALFKEANLPQAVVSNGRKKSVMAAQDAKGLSPHFEFILCKEDYEGRKPDPAPYLAALSKMEALKNQRIKPAECLVIEDDPKGVESGRAAGMQVIDRPPNEDDPQKFIEKCNVFLESNNL